MRMPGKNSGKGLRTDSHLSHTIMNVRTVVSLWNISEYYKGIG
jgi:hypothetical protein